jgi:hypothetical protein
MAYTDNPADFDLDLFMQALGYERGYGDGLEDYCLWSDMELTFFRREHDPARGDLLVIERCETESEQAAYEVARGWAELIPNHGPEEGPEEVALFTLRYRLPWPTTFDEAFKALAAIRWFGHAPTNLRLMRDYEALAIERGASHTIF